MKIVLTGSLGHISKPLVQLLVQKGHEITVISRTVERKNEIQELGASAAIGLLDDGQFLASTFAGAAIVYLMEPPINYFNSQANQQNYWLSIAKSYVHAIQQSGVKNVVHLSSIGAHTAEGVGMLSAHYEVEQVLRDLPAAVSIKFMRPVGFYYNMFAFIPAIKNARAIIQNYGGDEKEPWVSPLDIAEVIAEEMETPFNGRSVRYIASDEASPNEVAKSLGEAIGLPDLKWVPIPDEQFQNNLLKVGFNSEAAQGLTAMNTARLKDLYADYRLHRPILGKVKLSDFAADFAAVYHQQ